MKRLSIIFLLLTLTTAGYGMREGERVEIHIPATYYKLYNYHHGFGIITEIKKFIDGTAEVYVKTDDGTNLMFTGDKIRWIRNVY